MAKSKVSPGIIADIATFKTELDRELRFFLQTKTAEAMKISPVSGELLEHITDITMRGGKRIRAALLYYSYLAHGGKDKSAALRAAMAIELAQTYLLIHDDIIDHDDIRRGGQTIHKKYEDIAVKRYGKSAAFNYGQSVAILAGDIADAFSHEIIAGLPLDSSLVQRAFLELCYVYNLECFGELLDINAELAEDISREDVLQIHRLKTAPYTFDGPVKIGAILAGADDKTLKKLESYTLPLGIAFQIQDDILGMFGDDEKIGKPVLSDLQEGKKTLLILDALERGNASQRKLIEKNLGNPKAGLVELEQVRAVIKDSGALHQSLKLAHSYARKAVATIEKSDLKGEGKQFLAGIAEFIVHREY